MQNKNEKWFNQDQGDNNVPFFHAMTYKYAEWLIQMEFSVWDDWLLWKTIQLLTISVKPVDINIVLFPMSFFWWHFYVQIVG